MADNIGMARLWAGVHWRSDHEAGAKLGQVVACLVLRQLASICGGSFELCAPSNPVLPQCKCDDFNPCPDDPPYPCDKLTELARECAERCPPCGTSLEVYPEPCGPVVTAAAASADTSQAPATASAPQTGA